MVIARLTGSEEKQLAADERRLMVLTGFFVA